MSGNLELKVMLAAIDKASGPLKNISAAGKATAAALKATQAALKDMERQSRMIQGYQAQRDKLRELRDAMQRIRAAGQTKGLDKLEAASANLRRTIAASRSALQAAGIDTKRLAEAQASLGARMAAANAQIARQGAELGRIVGRHQAAARASREFQQAQERAAALRGSGITAVATGAAAGAPLYASARQSADLSSALVDIGIVSGTSAERLTTLRDQLQNIARDTNQSTADLATQLGALTAKGLSLDQAAASIAAIGRAATASNAEIVDIQETAGALMQNAGLSAQQIPSAFDALIKAGNQGAFELKNMAQEFPTLTAAAQKLGIVGMEATTSLAAGLQIARRGAGTGAEAANNLRNYLEKLASPETVKNFEKMGVNLPKRFRKWQREGKNALVETTKLVQDLTAGDPFKVGELFGDMQVKSFLQPFMAGIEDYRKIKAAAEQAAGTTQGQFTRRTDEDPTQKLKAASIALSTAGDRIGQSLLPVLAEAATKVANLADRFSAWAAANPVLANGLIKLAAGGAVLVMAIGAVMIALAALAPILAAVKFSLAALSFSGIGTAIAGIASRAIPLLIGALSALRVAVMANPIGAFITLLAGAAAYIWANWATLGPKFSALWSSIVAAASAAWEAIKAGFAALPGALASIGGQIMDGLIAGISAGAARVWGKIQEIAAGIKARFAAALQIQSPSRVFSGYGTQILAGLTQGLDRMAGPTVATMGRIASGVALAGAAAIAPAPLLASHSAAAVGGDTIHITVNAAPGQDPRAIALEVERILATRDRRGQARRRAALYDLD